MSYVDHALKYDGVVPIASYPRMLIKPTINVPGCVENKTYLPEGMATTPSPSTGALGRILDIYG